MFLSPEINYHQARTDERMRGMEDTRNNGTQAYRTFGSYGEVVEHAARRALFLSGEDMGIAREQVLSRLRSTDYDWIGSFLADVALELEAIEAAGGDRAVEEVRMEWVRTGEQDERRHRLLATR